MKKLSILISLFLLAACVTYDYGPMPGDKKYLVATKNVPAAVEAVYVAQSSLYTQKQHYNPFHGSKYDQWNGIMFVTPSSLVFMNVYERTGRFIEFFEIYYSEISEMNANTRSLYPALFGPDNPVSRQEYPIFFQNIQNSRGQEASFDEMKEYIKKKVGDSQR